MGIIEEVVERKNCPLIFLLLSAQNTNFLTLSKPKTLPFFHFKYARKLNLVGRMPFDPTYGVFKVDLRKPCLSQRWPLTRALPKGSGEMGKPINFAAHVNSVLELKIWLLG
ncbi:hypothetical protein [Okeania sp. SIO1I7]|uniref:hypothetical protein n=1 Tax=Okeania sp. SIO1I7 TaxID=2607772 RepID=UPI0013F7B161|nr:hypothetical protein [Okeania sp. SIO1I7]NET28474.1 hypothetical protein [Okeania sp. SIO1I7]